MEAEELRVGNYIFDDNYVVSNIKGIESSNSAKRWSEKYSLRIYIYPRDSKDDARYILDLVLCRPIPLTEEWLLKFGFERKPWGLVKGGLLFRDNIKNPCKELTLEVGNGFRVTLQYVHQLQNLYFALTGEELTVKEYEE